MPGRVTAASAMTPRSGESGIRRHALTANTANGMLRLSKAWVGKESFTA
jgi:hypothetical protein